MHTAVLQRELNNDKFLGVMPKAHWYFALTLVGIMAFKMVPFTYGEEAKLREVIDLVQAAKAQWAMDPTNALSVLPSSKPNWDQIAPYINFQGEQLTASTRRRLIEGTKVQDIELNRLDTAPTFVY
jgi:hypothetical protein